MNEINIHLNRINISWNSKLMSLKWTLLFLTQDNNSSLQISMNFVQIIKYLIITFRKKIMITIKKNFFRFK